MVGGEGVVHVEDFVMRFGPQTVIDHLDFDVMAGDTFGFLGSNGSGKTTTIRCLLGIYQPTSGILHIDGHNFEPGQLNELGYLPEERGLYKKESVLTTMIYFGHLKGLTTAEARRWSLRYLERVGLPDKATTRLDKLSGGEQQKVQLGVTIMNRPRLLILDEPTKGFDPVNRRLLLDIVEERKREGATIIMVTHQMDDVERICNRIILLKDGKARAYGTVPQVQEQFGGTTVKLTYHGPLPNNDHYHVVADDNNGHAELALAPGTDPAGLLRWLLDQHVTIDAFTPSRRSLESIFVEVYGAENSTDAITWPTGATR